MPVHDWTRVDAGVFHDFHTAWITEIRNALNGGLLPSGYYALSEQHAGRHIADVLTLHDGHPSPEPPLPHTKGGVALAEAPPHVKRKVEVSLASRVRRRTLTVRHVSGHRIIALVEIVSPANKDRARHVEEFADKVEEALQNGIHVLLVDLIPPGLHDPGGMHAVVWDRFSDDQDQGSSGEPLMLASYLADVRPVAYLEDLSIGASLPDMPLFLDPDRYVSVPLDSTYSAAYRGTPEFWRQTLEQSRPAGRS